MDKDKALAVGPMGNFSSFNRLDEMFNTVFSQFDRLWSTPTTYNALLFEDLQSTKTHFPKMDVYETDSHYSVDAAVAGFDKESIEIEVKDNTLYIKGVKNESNATDDKRYLKREISKRSFRRVVRFPEHIDTNNITCVYENGILHCEISKKKEIAADTPIKITIN